MGDTGFGGRALQARLNLSAKRGRSITQVEVAKALKVTSATVGRWEAGLKEPSLDTIIRLATFLQIDPGWLAFGGGPLQASNGVRIDVGSVAPVPEEAPSDGVHRIEREPHETPSVPPVSRRGKHDRPVQKKPPS